MTISEFLFKNRSYTPIPFVLVMLIFAKPYYLSIGIGFVISIIGEMFRFWGVSYIGGESRTTSSVGGSKLVISGPYAYTRNPLYTGNILIYTGIGISSNALFPFLFIAAFLFFVLQYYFIVKDEEKYLSTKFNDLFSDYCKNVRRFLPRLTPYINKESKKIELDLSEGFKSETRTLQGFFLIHIILLIIWFYQMYGK